VACWSLARRLIQPTKQAEVIVFGTKVSISMGKALPLSVGSRIPFLFISAKNK
jgi:hypothetical protein